MGNVQPRAFTDHTVHMGISGMAELSEFLWEASPMSATVPAASRRKKGSYTTTTTTTLTGFSLESADYAIVTSPSVD